MATPIGTNVVTSIARRYIMPEIVDNIYSSNPLFFRLNAANKKIVRGGTQIEVPLMYSRMAAGGAYQGLDLLDVTPSDTVKNGAWDWKQYYVPVTVDGLTLIKTDSPESVADFIRFYFGQAEMEMCELLGDGVFSDTVTATKKIDGIQGAIDDGTVAAAATYGGILRTAGNDTWFQGKVDAASPLDFPMLNTGFGTATVGGRHPTIIVSTQANYNRYWVKNIANQRFPAEPGGHDTQLAAAGFTNLLFNGVPWVVDSHVQTNHLYMLNEDFFYLAVSPRADFYLEDFQQPVNQDAMVAKLLWAGNLIVTNPGLSLKFHAIIA